MSDHVAWTHLTESPSQRRRLRRLSCGPQLAHTVAVLPRPTLNVGLSDSESARDTDGLPGLRMYVVIS